MGVFDMIVVAIVVGAIMQVVRLYFKNKSRADSKEITALRQELEQMQQRVQTLETIVTQDGYDLKAQFKQL